MGNKLFGVDISGLINKNVAPGLLDATLIKTAEGARTSGQLTGGPAITETPYAAKGFIQDYSENRIDGTVIKVGDRQVILIGDSIASAQVPSLGDKVTIEGTTYNIVGVPARDPAAATYSCQVRA